jgi:hypothetical protein
MTGMYDLPFYDLYSTYHVFQLFSFQKQAGCDHILNSKARKDKCGICGGDNSSCKTVAGTFNTVHYGKNLLQRIGGKETFKHKLLTSGNIEKYYCEGQNQPCCGILLIWL